MDNLLVCSDLHGNIDSLSLLLERIEHEHADALWCAGDVGLDRLGTHREALRSLRIPFLLVRGNCDSPWVFAEYGFNLPPRYLIEKQGNRTLLLTHGDIIRDWRAAPIHLEEHDIFIHGHTHIALLSGRKGSPIILNPGSASSPRDGRAASYAVITHDRIQIKELRSGRIIQQLSP